MDSLAFSPDGKRVGGGAVMAVIIWDAETGQVAQLLKPHASGGATHLRFSKDGNKLTTVHDIHGTNGPAGEDLLVYPTVKEWEVGGGL
jgi:WD40 repeat protein